MKEREAWSRIGGESAIGECWRGISEPCGSL